MAAIGLKVASLRCPYCRLSDPRHAGPRTGGRSRMSSGIGLGAARVKLNATKPENAVAGLEFSEMAGPRDCRYSGQKEPQAAVYCLVSEGPLRKRLDFAAHNLIQLQPQQSVSSLDPSLSDETRFKGEHAERARAVGPF